MATRMEKYKNNSTRTSRSSRNKSLYNTMYSSSHYSNIEGVASIDNDKEIDIAKVKQMLEEKERVSERQYRRPDREKVIEDIPMIRKMYTESDNNYDIMDVLKEAKENKKPDNKERVLDNTNYDILKKLNLKNNKISTSENKTEEEKKEDLKELIETISSTSILNKANDEDLAMDMFHELTDDDTKVGEIKDIREFIDTNEKTMDDSFFTGKIKNADFVGGKKKTSPLKVFFIIVLILVVLGLVAFLALYNMGIID